MLQTKATNMSVTATQKLPVLDELNIYGSGGNIAETFIPGDR